MPTIRFLGRTMKNYNCTAFSVCKGETLDVSAEEARRVIATYPKDFEVLLDPVSANAMLPPWMTPTSGNTMPVAPVNALPFVSLRRSLPPTVEIPAQDIPTVRVTPGPMFEDAPEQIPPPAPIPGAPKISLPDSPTRATPIKNIRRSSPRMVDVP